MLTDTAPFVGIQYCGLAWAMAHPLLQSQLVKYYGDRRTVEDQYETSTQWMDLVSAHNPESIVRDGLGDHESLEPTPVPSIVTPLYFQSAGILARLAGLLGLKSDEDRFDALADAVREAYLQKVLSSSPDRFDGQSQAALATALALGILSEDVQDRAFRALSAKTCATPEKSEPALTTGIFGTKFLLEALSSGGRADVAYDVVKRKSFPGWDYMLERGATTLWEHWDFSDNTFSHNHPMFGSVSEWFYRWLAGIQPAPGAFGFDRILLRPQPVGDLKWAAASVRTVRGEIKSKWRIEAGNFLCDVEIPANTRAGVYVPSQDSASVLEGGRPAATSDGVRFVKQIGGCSVYEIGSGVYSFSVPLGSR